MSDRDDCTFRVPPEHPVPDDRVARADDSAPPPAGDGRAGLHLSLLGPLSIGVAGAWLLVVGLVGLLLRRR